MLIIMKRIFVKYQHYMLCTIAASLILSGLLLMVGEGSTNENFCPDIFSARRIRIAPLLCLAGYLMLIPAIVCGHKEVTGKDGHSRD
jgi:hypothetical protein